MKLPVLSDYTATKYRHFDNSMDFYNSPAPYTHFGSIILQVDEAHRAVCGGAQGPGALGRLLKIHDFFDSPSYSLRACSRLVLVLQETCLRMPNHALKILFGSKNSKLDSPILKIRPQAAKTCNFAKFAMFRTCFFATGAIIPSLTQDP